MNTIEISNQFIQDYYGKWIMKIFRRELLKNIKALESGENYEDILERIHSPRQTTDSDDDS